MDASGTGGRCASCMPSTTFFPGTGSEIYAAQLCKAVAPRHHVTIVCADYDPVRAHGEDTEKSQISAFRPVEIDR